MEEEDFSKLSIEERCTHKLWKARLSGYEAAANLFRQIDDEKSPEWNKYMSLVKKFVVDSNAPAQEKGLEAVLAFVENCASAGKTAGDVLAGLVQKCISAPKARTKELASQIALMYIEIEKQEIVLEELMKGTESKNPKIVSASIHIINQSLTEFGAKTVSIGKILKRVPKLLEDRDNNVRAEAKLLLLEMYRWLGPAIKSQLSNLKPVQITELDAEYEKIKDTPVKAVRLLRSQQIKKDQEVRDNGGDEGDGDEVYEQAEEINPYDLLDPVDILGQLPKDFYTQLEAKKWSDRKDALEALEKLLNSSPKIENADYGDLIRALKKIISKDSNIVVVGLAIKCTTGLANGLRKKFHQYASVMMATLFEKFKEKKQNVVLALREAVDAIFPSTSLELLLEDVIVSLDNKNPSIKAEIASFLARCFAKSTSAALNKKLLKPLTKSLLKCLVDQDPAVRDNAAQALGTAMKAAGEKNINPFLVDVDNQKMAKIKECYEKAEILVKPPKPQSTRAPKEEAAKKSTPESKPVAKVVRPKGASSVPSAVNQMAGVSLSQEECLQKAQSLLNSSLISDLTDSDSSTRLNAYISLLKEIKSCDVNEETGQILLHVLNYAQIEETEPEIIKLKLQTMKFIADTMPLLPDIASVVLPEAAALILKPECGENAIQVLWSFTNSLSLDNVANSLLANEKVVNDSKLWAEMLNWLSFAIMKTGVVNSDFIVDCGKKALNHSDSAVRNAGLALIGTIHLQGGSNNTGGDASPLRSTDTFTRPAKSASSSDISKRAREKPQSAGKSGENGKLNKAASSEILSRIDIGPQITEQIINELSDKNWKVRAEAVSKIQTIVSSAQSITPNLGESPIPIAARINDSNSKIAASAIALVESLAHAIGPSCKQHVRVFLPALIKVMGDTKPWIKNAVIPCLNTWGETGGYKEFFEGEIIADALKSGSPSLRSELWAWLSEKLPNIPLRTIPKDELTACLPTLYANLEDRNAEVRKNACEAVLGFMMHLGFNNMSSACDNMKGASGVQVKQILEKTRGSVPERAVPKSKSSPEKSSAKPSIGKLAPGSSATITKSTKSKGNAVVKSAGSRKKDEDVDNSPLLQVNNLKHQRVIDEQKLKTLKWNFVSPRSEFIELLKEQMLSANVNKTLIANMFHTDFKYHLRAIDALTEDLPTNRAALISNLDLILRWMTIRFFDTNPSVLLKGLEYLNTVFNVLIEEEYNMLDSEASAFFPYLILKVGDPKDTVRISVRALFKQIGAVYPLTKQFVYIMEGVKSKNARQRAECLEQLCWLIDNYGLNVCHPSPQVSLKEIAKHISDRDTSVRNAALNLVVTAHFLEGDKVLKMVSHISEKDFSLLEERIKRANKNRPIASVKPLFQPVTTRDQQQEHLESEMQEEMYEDEEQPQSPRQYQQIQTNINASRVSEVSRANLSPAPGPYDLDQHVIEEIECAPETLQVPKLADIDLQFLKGPSTQATIIKPIQMPKMTPTLLNFTKPTAIKWELAQIASSDIEKAMASIMQIDTVLNSEKRNHLSGFVDYMVQQLVHQLIILNQSAHPEVVNGYRANFSLLLKLCNYSSLCGEIQEETLYKIIEQLLLLLAEKKTVTLEKHELFTRVVNALVLKLLDHANKTNIMCALIKLLYDAINNPEASSHFQELTIKSLWKLNRTQPDWDHELDYARVLIQFNNFLRDFPTAWWKTQDADVPLRTVKTLLHSMVRIRGLEVKETLKNIPSISSESELVCYVKKLIRRLKIDESVEGTASPQRSYSITSSKENDSNTQNTHTTNVSTPHRIPKEIQEELSEIFKMLGDTELTQEGIKRLFIVQKTHPESVQQCIAKTTPVFQQYIMRGLASLEQQQYDQANSNRVYNRKSFADPMDHNKQENAHTLNKKQFSKEAERLWNRLHHLQEKAGCHVEKQNEETKESTKEKTVSHEACETSDVELQSLRDRLEMIKTNMG
ncbi:protein mini spindles isoform X2 [Cimex lectularius]|uniref:TOG domain-containing protein n=1 Tax=Cimex lectularius TaxID=79782 RepID=A0A8I6TGN0_CIMLE|nr:protein mini spindles isoform X2 [Cimex lectularius]